MLSSHQARPVFFACSSFSRRHRPPNTNMIGGQRRAADRARTARTPAMMIELGQSRCLRTGAEPIGGARALGAPLIGERFGATCSKGTRAFQSLRSWRLPRFTTTLRIRHSHDFVEGTAPHCRRQAIRRSLKEHKGPPTTSHVYIPFITKGLPAWRLKS